MNGFNKGLEEKVVDKNKLKKEILIGIFKIFFLLIFCFGFYHLSLDTKDYSVQKYAEIKKKIREKFTVVEYMVVTDELDGPSLHNIISRISKEYKISPIITKAIIKKESNFKNDAIRFEQTWKNQYASKISRIPGENDHTYDMNFYSIGLMQIGYGLHKTFCGLNSYTDLFKPEINISCGLKIIRSCLERSNISSQGQKIKQCIKQYNGGGERAETYSIDILSDIATELLNE